MEQITQKRRVALLDEIRGLCILGVVVFHGLYDLVDIFDLSIPFFQSFFVLDVVQPIGAGAFILISGIVSRYSRSNLKRGLQTLALSFGIEIVTQLVMPANAIRFGILSLLGCGMLLYGLVERFAPKLLQFSSKSHVPGVVALVSFLLFAFTYEIGSKQLGFFSKSFIKLPSYLYQSEYLYFLGFPTNYFFSADYFPLLPWIFLFIAGTYLGVYFVQERIPEWFYKPRIKFLSFVGKRSLLIYILHQPILFGLFSLLFYLIG